MSQHKATHIVWRNAPVKSKVKRPRPFTQKYTEHAFLASKNRSGHSFLRPVAGPHEALCGRVLEHVLGGFVFGKVDVCKDCAAIIRFANRETR